MSGGPVIIQKGDKFKIIGLHQARIGSLSQLGLIPLQLLKDLETKRQK